MKLLQVALVSIVALGTFGFFGQQAMAAPGKVVICHIPPGNPDAAHTIIVGKSAVPAHLSHGDLKGICDFDGDGENDEPSMVTICHVPPGNPANAHTITIGEPAVDHHFINHEGDSLGPCGSDDGPTD